MYQIASSAKAVRISLIISIAVDNVQVDRDLNLRQKMSESELSSGI